MPGARSLKPAFQQLCFSAGVYLYNHFPGIRRFRRFLKAETTSF